MEIVSTKYRYLIDAENQIFGDFTVIIFAKCKKTVSKSEKIL